KKEEQLVTASVEVRPGNQNRTAKRIARIFEPIRRLRDSEQIVIPGVCVEHFVAPEIISGSMELVRAVLDTDAHLSAGTRAKFRLRAGQHDSHLSNRIDVGSEKSRPRSIPDVLVRHTVKRDHELAGLSAVDLGSASLSRSVPIAVIHHTRQKPEQS